ncbi:hypothetical protein Tco_0398371 [Tanacetum coccineum]
MCDVLWEWVKWYCYGSLFGDVRNMGGKPSMAGTKPSGDYHAAGYSPHFGTNIGANRLPAMAVVVVIVIVRIGVVIVPVDSIVVGFVVNFKIEHLAVVVVAASAAELLGS